MEYLPDMVLKELVHWIDFDVVLPLLRQKGIITRNMLPLPVLEDRDMAILNRIKASDEESQKKFLDILLSTGHFEAARLVNEHVNPNDYLDVVAEPNAVGAARNLVHYHSNGASDHNGDCVDGENGIIVKKATEIHGLPEAYKMTSHFRGLALLINNKDFDYGMESRSGSDNDVKRLTSVFNQLEYKIYPYENLDYKRMRKVILDFSRLPELEFVDSCVVCIMTHGNWTGLYATDERPVEREWVFDKFSNSNCPYLQEKPKVFIIQACRGYEEDKGSVKVKTSNVNNEHQFDSGGHGRGRCVVDENEVNLMPTYSDMYIIYPSVPGYKALRHIKEGSWMIRVLCEKIAEHAHDKHIREIKDEVSKQIREMRGRLQDGGYILETICDETRGFDRAMYFNPGL